MSIPSCMYWSRHMSNICIYIYTFSTLKEYTKNMFIYNIHMPFYATHYLWIPKKYSIHHCRYYLSTWQVGRSLVGRWHSIESLLQSAPGHHSKGWKKWNMKHSTLWWSMHLVFIFHINILLLCLEFKSTRVKQKIIPCLVSAHVTWYLHIRTPAAPTPHPFV